jgi:gamma-glutamylcyclotransferase (GGCT)/AIG2-like uncharacterized protein YtfP
MQKMINWYFAYGSNLKRSHLRKIIGEWKQEHCAVLKNFTLSFAKGYSKYKSGFANIKPHPDMQVEGVAYLITEHQFKKLDAYEEVGLGVYRREPVIVETNVDSFSATTYEMNKEICLLSPSSYYLKIVLN